MNKNNLKKYAYLAGLIDGDGCITISKTYVKSPTNPDKKYDRYFLKVEVSSSDVRLIKYLVGAFGGRYGISNRKQGLSNHPNFFWQLFVKQQKEILKKILPFIQLKKQQVQLAIRYCELHKGRDNGSWCLMSNGKRYTDKEYKKLEEFWVNMKKLNQTMIRNLSIMQPQRLSKKTSIKEDAIVRT